MEAYNAPVLSTWYEGSALVTAAYYGADEVLAALRGLYQNLLAL